MKPILLYDSPITSASGYGEHSREVASYILSLENKFDIYFNDSSWGFSQSCNLDNNLDIKSRLKKKLSKDSIDKIDIYIKLGLVTDFRKIGRINIGITSLCESTLCPPEYADYLKLCDSVVVPSEFNRNTIKNSLNINNDYIFTIPQCFICTNNKKQSDLKQTLDGIEEEFCFLYNGKWNQDVHAIHDRKNVNQLIRTFISATHELKEKPALILKTYNKNYSVVDYEQTLHSIKAILNDSHVENPSIYLIHGNLSPSEIKTLYKHKKVKASLNMSRGESFGRPIMESFIYETPCIIPNWSAPVEYVTSSNFLIDGKLVKHPKIQNAFIEGGEWFDVNIEEYSQKIKDVIVNYEMYKSSAIELSNKIQKTHNKKTIGKQYKELICSYL